MCQCDRLCLLKMGKSRHVGVHILFHDLLQCNKKRFQLFIRLIDLITDIKLHIKCNLIITASSCVQLLTSVTDAVNQIRLHEAVDILVFGCDRKLSSLHICKNSVQAFCDLILLFLCQDALFCKHGNVCLASVDILFIEFLVKRNRCIKIINQLVRLLCKTASP